MQKRGSYSCREICEQPCRCACRETIQPVNGDPDSASFLSCPGFNNNTARMHLFFVTPTVSYDFSMNEYDSCRS
jgi:hypothetical protein